MNQRNATIPQTNTTRKANRIEEGLHHQNDTLEDETLSLIIVNSKADMGSKTVIETIIITIGIKIDPTAITDMATEHEEMIIGDVTLITTIKTENKMIL